MTLWGEFSNTNNFRRQAMLSSLLFAACFASFLVGHCRSNYFYIYDWSPEFSGEKIEWIIAADSKNVDLLSSNHHLIHPFLSTDVWPQPDAVLHPDSPYDHGFYENNGVGKKIDPDIGLFLSWQFSLFKNAMSRLWVSKYRTRDPSLANAFIVPFDAGVHSYVDHKTGKVRLASPHAWAVIRWLQEAQKSKIFWKNSGHDHFVFFSLTEFVMTGICVSLTSQ